MGSIWRSYDGRVSTVNCFKQVRVMPGSDPSAVAGRIRRNEMKLLCGSRYIYYIQYCEYNIFIWYRILKTHRKETHTLKRKVLLCNNLDFGAKVWKYLANFLVQVIPKLVVFQAGNYATGNYPETIIIANCHILILAK